MCLYSWASRIVLKEVSLLRRGWCLVCRRRWCFHDNWLEASPATAGAHWTVTHAEESEAAALHRQVIVARNRALALKTTALTLLLGTHERVARAHVTQAGTLHVEDEAAGVTAGTHAPDGLHAVLAALLERNAKALALHVVAVIALLPVHATRASAGAAKACALVDASDAIRDLKVELAVAAKPCSRGDELVPRGDGEVDEIGDRHFGACGLPM